MEKCLSFKKSDEFLLKEAKYWYITLSENQYYLGRAIIIFNDFSKKHLYELGEKEIKELFFLIKGYEVALKKTFKTTNFNWTCLMNDSYKEKNTNKKAPLHFHVWPRYKNKVIFKKETFCDEVFAHHYDKHKEKIVKKAFLEKLADKILQNGTI